MLFWYFVWTFDSLFAQETYNQQQYDQQQKYLQVLRIQTKTIRIWINI